MPSPDKSSCGLILLAAGASTRMGRPKQLLPVNDRPLLRHVVDACLSALVSPVIVVLGANAPDISPCLAGLPFHLVVNTAWTEGMGSSLRAGMKALVSHSPAATGVIVALADQPDVPASHFMKLIETQRTTGRTIVASESAGVRGPPVLFAAGHFPALLALRGDAGARVLLHEHADQVAVVTLAAARDLDTPADYVDYIRQLGC